VKIAIYGATGNIGPRLVAEALRRGHEVTAIGRTERAIAQGATFVTGDAADPAFVERIAGSHDVVVSALNTNETFLDSIRALIAHAGTTRLIVVGGAGSLLTSAGTRLVDAPEFPAGWKAGALLQTQALDLLLAADPDVDWTYLSPAPEISAGERTGKYLTALDEPAGEHISYEDYAVALLDEIESPQHGRQRFTVAN